MTWGSLLLFFVWYELGHACTGRRSRSWAGISVTDGIGWQG